MSRRGAGGPAFLRVVDGELRHTAADSLVRSRRFEFPTFFNSTTSFRGDED
jgi:hypothetical protein